ncbi:MAG: HNH endonuclease signature motif containing protein [Acidimicrobiales bacterium]
MELGSLTEVIDGLVATGGPAFADAGSIVALHRELARLEAIVTTATAAFDTSRDWETDGAKSAGAWIATRCRLPKTVARRRASLGRRLRNLPVCEREWLAGEITGSHVATIAAVRRDATAEALARDEKLLVDNAKHLRFEAFVTTVAYWDQLADPDGAEDDDQARRNRRDVYLAESFNAMFLGKMTLDPISGTIVSGELERRERELFEADWAAAKAELGREPTIFDLARTPGQRRADALVEMAARSAAMHPDARRPAPLFTIMVGYETVHGRICQLADGTVVSPGALLPWLEQAYIERAVFTPDRRVEVSKKARLFKGATRRGVELRDQQCAHPYCDMPASHCQVDHITPYTAGGPTTQQNGQLLCGYHNRLKQRRGPPDDPSDP